MSFINASSSFILDNVTWGRVGDLPLLKIECLANLVHELEVLRDSIDVHKKVTEWEFKFKCVGFILSTLKEIPNLTIEFKFQSKNNEHFK